MNSHLTHMFSEVLAQNPAAADAAAELPSRSEDLDRTIVTVLRPRLPAELPAPRTSGTHGRTTPQSTCTHTHLAFLSDGGVGCG